MRIETRNYKDTVFKLLFNNKLYLNYRLKLDGRPQYVSLVIMRLDHDSDFIIVAVENVDEIYFLEFNTILFQHLFQFGE